MANGDDKALLSSLMDGSSMEPEISENDMELDEVLKVWEENGYVDYMSHQRDKGWKT